ncbi:uncharacterized protein FIBRA_03610 [Fibroporia radiculosa]|uniref:DUF300-domain-containing protein n=1 Tax=Fibroporia radiculosa TaxID=599839 RepID=J4HW31_9APHY|nr:uncharacterized protein FIBRA_03610 [Fibroporia radiculosa]CCM01552.1 predicted protein [Fibroporia radiculosa]
MVNSTLCPSDNTAAVEQDSFWSTSGVDWDDHRIGWLIAGCCAVVTVVFTIFNVLQHCLHYTNRSEQRQILRILYMPAVYAVISFVSYRFFRSYTYYSLIESAYESVTLSAFLLLLIEFVAATALDHNIDNAIARKDKTKLPIPFCFWRYRPTKAYFMYTLKWSVLQYVIIRPVLSIVGIICQAYGVLCESGPLSFKTANAYIELYNTYVGRIALYGLILFYGLTREELKGRRPLAKFLSIKLIVMFTFYQGLIFDALEGRVIHATQYWTETNIADGLNALATTIEMVFFSAFMIFAFSAAEYKVPGVRTGIGRPLIDSINYSDFAVEIAGSLKFFVAYALRRPYTRGTRKTITDRDGKTRPKMDFGEAFGVAAAGGSYSVYSAENDPVGGLRPRMSYDENIRLAPYTYASPPAAMDTRVTAGSPGSSAASLQDGYASPGARSPRRSPP